MMYCCWLAMPIQILPTWLWRYQLNCTDRLVLCLVCFIDILWRTSGVAFVWVLWEKCGSEREYSPQHLKAYQVWWSWMACKLYAIDSIHESICACAYCRNRAWLLCFKSAQRPPASYAQCSISWRLCCLSWRYYISPAAWMWRHVSPPVQIQLALRHLAAILHWA